MLGEKRKKTNISPFPATHTYIKLTFVSFFLLFFAPFPKKKQWNGKKFIFLHWNICNGLLNPLIYCLVFLELRLQPIGTSYLWCFEERFPKSRPPKTLEGVQLSIADNYPLTVWVSLLLMMMVMMMMTMIMMMITIGTNPGGCGGVAQDEPTNSVAQL